jgi:hypothetical protein
VFGLGVLGALGAGIAYLLFGHLVGSTLFHSPALVMVTGPVAAWIAIMTLQTLFAESFRGFSNLFLATILRWTWVDNLSNTCHLLRAAVVPRRLH